MVWKNQESGGPWLVGFWVSWCWKMQNISANTFFFLFSFLNHHYGSTTYLEILNFHSFWIHAESSFSLQNLPYRNSLENSYQILRWIMSKLGSRKVLSKIVLFVLEFSSLKGWKLVLYQIIHILKNENYH